MGKTNVPKEPSRHPNTTPDRQGREDSVGPSGQIHR